MRKPSNDFPARRRIRKPPLEKWQPKRKFKMRKVEVPPVPRSAFPSFFTVMNMVCGYASIVMASKQDFIAAGWFIIFAAVFDTLDGFIARLAQATSEFGVELDSLSDLVSFGAAPSFLVYKYGLESFGNWGLVISSFLMVCSGLRLARFNVQLVGFDKDYFTGLPTPSQAMTVASFIIWTSTESFAWKPEMPAMLAGLTICLSAAMVSKVKYDLLLRPTAEGFRKHPVKYGFYIAAAFAIVIYQAKGFFIAITVYILHGVCRSLYHFFSEEQTPAAPDAKATDAKATESKAGESKVDSESVPASMAANASNETASTTNEHI
ncbi:MAG: CDP-diacylglycerol--serine O-phosphatidyltransferase [Rhizobacter sp.]|nr:CDP-diacylglycerol--serine O-phosphatidyltransferase [Chlorobiales bacterium]